MTSAPSPQTPRSGALEAFAFRDFRLHQAARFAWTLAIQMLSIAVGWQVYDLTRRPLDLGFVGLAQFLPAFLLSPLTGFVADRFDKRTVLLLANLTFLSGTALLLSLSQARTQHVNSIYLVLFLLGCARAFSGPAGQALLPHLVPRKLLQNAVALSATIWEVAAISGPALGGIIYAAYGSASAVYLVCTGFMAMSFVCYFAIRVRTHATAQHSASFANLAAGLRFVWTEKVILGAISLDLFAVLLGGAVALLPVFARDILHVGPLGLGLLRSAPAVGAAVVALVLAFRPLRRNVGRRMLACVFVFGVATVVFGLSRNFYLSLAAMAVTGAVDMVSVVVRQTLVQMRTPEDMRGRVSAVNLVFVGASNELGEFESGVAAAAFGTVAAVVLGGVGTCLVVLLWWKLFPQLRDIDSLESGTANES